MSWLTTIVLNNISTNCKPIRASTRKFGTKIVMKLLSQMIKKSFTDQNMSDQEMPHPAKIYMFKLKVTYRKILMCAIIMENILSVTSHIYCIIAF